MIHFVTHVTKDQVYGRCVHLDAPAALEKARLVSVENPGELFQVEVWVDGGEGPHAIYQYESGSTPLVHLLSGPLVWPGGEADPCNYAAAVSASAR